MAGYLQILLVIVGLDFDYRMLVVAFDFAAGLDIGSAVTAASATATFVVARDNFRYFTSTIAINHHAAVKLDMLVAIAFAGSR